jgi:hypothetical protein
MTTISCGSTSMRPNSVAKRRRPLLRHDQQLAVGIVEKAIGHRPVRRVQMDAAAGHGRRISVARHGDQSIDEIGRRVR